MHDLPSPDDLSRFSDFKILTATYKTVSNHGIKTYVLIPKRLLAPPATPAAPSPVILRYHGGGFITGSGLYPGFFQPWHMELAARHSAVIVSPDYRLAPEASIDDILEDVEDHWTWLRTQLPAFVQTETGGHVSVDAGRVLTAGDSAGGYLSLVTGLSHGDEIRASVAAYPCMDMADPVFRQVPDAPVPGSDPSDRNAMGEHLERIRKGEVPPVLSEDPKIERGGLMFAAQPFGLFSRLFPFEKRHLFPFENLRDGARFPRGGVFVWHGDEDSIVPVRGSVALEKLVKELDPELPFRLTVRPGDHVFDFDAKIDDEWMAEGLAGLVKAWLE